MRRGEPNLARKSTDCGPSGCYAWIQIDYSREEQEAECSKLTDEKFADPAECQNTIEDFKNVKGYSAASLRKRVDLLWQEYDAAKHSLLDVGDELLRSAAAESNSASQLAWRCEQLSWVLYVVGTLIIMFGRAKSALAARKADEPKAGVT